MVYKTSLKELVGPPIDYFNSGTIQGVVVTGGDGKASDLVKKALLEAGVPLKKEGSEKCYHINLLEADITDISHQAT